MLHSVSSRHLGKGGKMVHAINREGGCVMWACEAQLQLQGSGGMPPGKSFKMDSLRHILVHSQPNIMMGRLFTRTSLVSSYIYRSA